MSYDRCVTEIAEMEAKTDKPAWLVTLGIEDWECEKRFILEKQTSHVATGRIAEDILLGGSTDARQSAGTFREIPPSVPLGQLLTVERTPATKDGGTDEAKP